MTLQEELEKNLMEHYEKYYRFAYGYVRNQEDALDIIQDSAYKAIKNQGKLRNRKKIDSWIYSIIRNTALDFLKKKKREFPMEDEVLYEMSGTQEMNEPEDNFSVDRKVVVNYAEKIQMKADLSHVWLDLCL